jgi:ferredoxin
MKIIVDSDLCEANAQCVKVAPDVFRLDDEDKLHLLIAEIPEERRAQMETAVRKCPRRALSIG